MIGLNVVYPLAGMVFVAFAVSALRDRMRWNAIFYGLIALSFLAGDFLGSFTNGILALAMAGVAGLGKVGRDRQDVNLFERVAEAARRGNRLFLPALIIPATALIGTFAFKAAPDLVDTKNATLVALSLGVVLALVTCQLWFRPALPAPFVEGRRLMDSIGWAGLLPQMLASLGAVFALAGVGQVVGGLLGEAIPDGSLLGAVLVYGLGMALFTAVMGNAFAAFPVMMSAVGVPLLIRGYGGDPAMVAAIGMLAGFCGTLLTPMAANFNIVPAALLELNDRYAVIRAQAPTAVPLLIINLCLLYWLAFR